MLEKFTGEDGRRLRRTALFDQTIVNGNEYLADELTDLVTLREIASGEIIIEQNGEDSDLIFILSGSVSIIVNGRQIAVRGRRDYIGEMSAIDPTQRRSATVIAIEPTLVAVLSEAHFSDLGTRYPDMYRHIARTLSRRLLQRNQLVGLYREKIRVFIISSAEALPVARIVQSSFNNDPFVPVVWTDGVFKIANYTLQDLENEVDNSDFAIAIAHADDFTESRGKDWPSPRDNVIFELGLFMGRLGRSRAVLMEPREERVKLPSDLSGVTTIAYRYEKGADAAALLAPACNVLRDHINSLGPNNG